MVGTTGTVDDTAVHDIQERLYRCVGDFVEHDPAKRRVTVDVDRLTRLVADIVAEQTAALRAALCGVLGHDQDPDHYPGDDRVVADLRELAAESRVRENEVISLGCEVEKLEGALFESARDSEIAARFVDTMLGGA